MTSIASRLKSYCAGHTAEWYDERTEYMISFLTEERVDVLRRTLAERTRYMTILTENTFHPQNASALVRHCEAFGVQELHAIEFLCGFQANLHIVRGTDKWVDIRRYGSTAEAVAHLKGEGYRIVAVMPRSEAALSRNVSVGVTTSMQIVVSLVSTKIEVRKRLSFGSLERQTSQLQVIIGMPWDVPLPNTVTFIVYAIKIVTKI